MNDNSFNPALASRQLGENARKMDELSAKIIDKRNELLFAEAKYMDAKASSYAANKEKMSATAAQQMVNLETTEEKKEQMRVECELRNLQDLMNVLVEANNNLKVQIKLWDVEAKNLNL